jgi:hypothetical protein
MALIEQSDLDMLAETIPETFDVQIELLQRGTTKDAANERTTSFQSFNPARVYLGRFDLKEYKRGFEGRPATEKTWYCSLERSANITGAVACKRYGGTRVFEIVSDNLDESDFSEWRLEVKVYDA